MQNTFKNKPVVVLNKSLAPGRVMNALAHMCFGLGARLPTEVARLSEYIDADGGSHPNISEIPFIVLRANSNKIRALRQAAIAHNLQYADFTDTMVVGTYQDQLARTQTTPEAQFEYYGIVLFGDWEIVSELTRKFSLYK